MLSTIDPDEAFIRTMEDDDDEEYFKTLVYGQRETDQDAVT